MANLENEFDVFLKKVRILKGDSKYKDLLKSQKSNEDIIKKYFTDNKIKEPTFIEQGSFEMDTIVNPLNGDFDLDDGIYLNEKPEKYSEPSSVLTVHNWVISAVENITKDGTSDKNTCVRLNYKKEYHIDFPIYIVETNSKQYLAHKVKGWTESYPTKFLSWFENKISTEEQIRRIVIYLKAWKDYQQEKEKIKLPNGMILTLLAIYNYVKDDEDQFSFFSTCKNIKASLDKGYNLKRPVDPGENLFDECSEEKKKNLNKGIEDLNDFAQKAIKETSYVKSSEYWIKIFGDRFPKGEEPKRTITPPIIKNDNRSA